VCISRRSVRRGSGAAAPEPLWTKALYGVIEIGGVRRTDLGAGELVTIAPGPPDRAPGTRG
jgi:hypothetical protein